MRSPTRSFGGMAQALATVWLAATSCGGDDGGRGDASVTNATTLSSSGPTTVGSNTADDTGSTSPGSSEAGSTNTTGGSSTPTDVVIDFDDLSNGDIVTDQYDEFVTFSALPDLPNKVSYLLSATSSSPHAICTRMGQVCSESDTYLDFTHPVVNLTFYLGGGNTNGPVAKARIFENGVDTTVVDIVSQGGATTPELITALEGFANVTRVELFEVDDYLSVHYDDFAFTALVPGLSRRADSWIGLGARLRHEEAGFHAVTSP